MQDGVEENNVLSSKEMPQVMGINLSWLATCKAFAIYLVWDWLPLAVVTTSCLSYLFFSKINIGAKAWN